MKTKTGLRPKEILPDLPSFFHYVFKLKYQHSVAVHYM